MPQIDGTLLLSYGEAAKRALVPLSVVLTATTIVALSMAQAGPSDVAFGAPVPELPHDRSARARPVADPAQLLASSAPAENLSAVRRKLELAVPYLFRGTASAREYAVSCLSAAAWYEAGNDPAGQRSVIQVVLNRLRHPAFPKTVCGVVFQGSSRETGCQFTFTCDGSLDRRKPSPQAWESARLRAQAALDGAVDPDVAQATHYHADYVTPYWSDRMVKLATVGRQIFYRWPWAAESLTMQPIGGSDSDRQFVARLYETAMTPKSNQTAALIQDGSLEPRGADVPVLQSEKVLAVAAPGGPGLALSYVQTLGESEPTGRWAVQALGKCGNRRGCSVFGYVSSDAADKNSQLPPGKRDRPAFLFANDATSGATVTLWDCDRYQRPSPTQCLPKSEAAVRQLTNDAPAFAKSD